MVALVMDMLIISSKPQAFKCAASFSPVRSPRQEQIGHLWRQSIVLWEFSLLLPTATFFFNVLYSSKCSLCLEATVSKFKHFKNKFKMPCQVPSAKAADVFGKAETMLAFNISQRNLLSVQVNVHYKQGVFHGVQLILRQLAVPAATWAMCGLMGSDVRSLELAAFIRMSMMMQSYQVLMMHRGVWHFSGSNPPHPPPTLVGGQNHPGNHLNAKGLMAHIRSILISLTKMKSIRTTWKNICYTSHALQCWAFNIQLLRQGHACPVS